MAEELHFDNPAAAAQDPSTDAEALRQLAFRYPEVRPIVAAHPHAYRGLLDWLHQFNDPAINAALEARDDYDGYIDSNGYLVMHGDVSGFHTYHSLVWTQNGGYDSFVCLCAADEKMHIGIGGIADASDNLACILAVAVFAVSGGLLHVGLCKSLKDACMRSFGVVAFEVDHKSQIRCFRKFSQNLRNI